MYDIKYLEDKRDKILTDHIKLCHNTELGEAERAAVDELNDEIEKLKRFEEELKRIKEQKHE